MSAIPLLIQALKEKDAVTLSWTTTLPQAAAMALTGIGPDAKAAVPALEDCVRNADPGTRALSLHALASIGTEDPEALSFVLATLKDKKLEILTRRVAAQALRKVGAKARDAVPDLIELLSFKDSKDHDLTHWIRFTAVGTLQEIGPDAKAAIPALKEALKGASKSFKQNIESALRAIEKE